MVEEVIVFVLAGLVMLWAFRSAAFAFNGGDRSGLHEVASPSEAAAMLTAEEIEARYQRHHRVHQAGIFLASLGVAAALVALLIGALVA
jgi:hypothetical protein